MHGEKVLMRGTVVAPFGGVEEVPELVFEREPAAAASGTLDPSLIGHWRHTQALSSGGFSFVTDVHLVLQDDGTYGMWSRSKGSMGSTDSELTTGVWKVDSGWLLLRPDSEGVWRQKGAYSVSDQALLLTYRAGDNQVFQRA
jgi:hypothetical protein